MKNTFILCVLLLLKQSQQYDPCHDLTKQLMIHMQKAFQNKSNAEQFINNIILGLDDIVAIKNNCSSKNEFIEAIFENLNDEGQECIENMINIPVMTLNNISLLLQREIEMNEFYDRELEFLKQIPNVLEKCQKINIVIMSQLNVTNIIFEKSTQNIDENFNVKISFDALQPLKDIEWTVIYIGDASDKSADQNLDSIKMDEVEIGGCEFEWVIDSPNYQKLPDPFSVFDSSALIFCLKYKNQEFLRISYFVTHFYKNDEMKDDPPEQVQWQELKRVIKIDQPKLSMMDIDWSKQIIYLIMFLIILFSYLFQSFYQLGFGLDFGSDLIKGSFLVPGKNFSFIEDDMSKNKTLNIISFCSGKKFLEQQAFSKYQKMKCQTIRFLNQFLLTKNDRENVSKILSNNFELLEKDNEIFIIFNKNDFIPLKDITKDDQCYHNENQVKIRVEELIAMVMQKIKKNANRQIENTFQSAVITIMDNNLSIQSRKILFSALKLISLKPLQFIHENTAAAIQYVFKKNYQKNEKDFKLLVNIGSLSTKISLVQFYSTQEVLKNNQVVLHPSVKVLKDYTSYNFSGKILDFCLMKKFTPFEIDNFSTERKLLEKFKTQKQILSVNKQVKFTIEDVKSHNISITREQFEEKCQEEFQNLRFILQEFQQKIQGLELGQNIKEIELLGGVTRIPQVKFIIKSTFNLPIKTHIDGDMGSTLGTSIIAVKYSEGLKTKKVIFQDGPDQEYKIKVKYDDHLKEGMLFKSKSNYGMIKNLSLKDVKNNLKVKIINEKENYEIEYDVKGVESKWSYYKDKNITESNVILKFQLDNFGLPAFKSAQLNLNEIFIENSKKNSTEKLKKYQEILSVVKVRENIEGLFDNKEKFKSSLNLLRQISDWEKLQFEISKYKNQIEYYLYHYQEIQEEPDKSQFLTEEEKISYEQKTNELYEYLENIHTKSLDDIKQKLQNLEIYLGNYKKKSESFHNRKKLRIKVHKRLKELQQHLRDIKIKQNWLPEQKISKIKQRIKKFNNDFHDKMEIQEKQQPNEQPLITEDMVELELHKIKMMINKLELLKKEDIKKSDKIEEL